MVRKATENALVLDASVVVAVVLREPGYEASLDRVLGAEVTGIGAPSMVEAMIVLSSKLGRDAHPTPSQASLAYCGDDFARTDVG